MKTWFLVSIVVLCSLVTLSEASAGVSLSIGQPGFYGRINIGGFSPPPVLYQQPIAINRVPMDRAPIYLHVPANHARQWKRHCHDYNACGERVLFVQKQWYNQKFAPRYQAHQRGGNGHGHRRGSQQQGRGGSRH